MPLAIEFTPKTRMLVAQKTGQSLPDVEAMLNVALEAKTIHGPCYVVIDYPAPDGRTVPWASMHAAYFDKHFAFKGTEYHKKFVPVTVLTPTTH